jgi:hypothetical protein
LLILFDSSIPDEMSQEYSREQTSTPTLARNRPGAYEWQKATQRKIDSTSSAQIKPEPGRPGVSCARGCLCWPPSLLLTLV